MKIDSTKQLQIFDLGNVLVKVDSRKTIEALEALGMPHQELPVSNSHAAGGIFSLYCDGKVTRQEFLDGVRKMCSINGTDQQIIDAWNAMLGAFSPDSIETVRQARRQGHKVALLSNCNELHTIYCRSIFPKEYGAFDDLFDAAFFSQEIGMSKPKPETWQLVLNHFKIPASDAAFYDDSPINIAAAQKLGIAAYPVEI